jgi:hypothetical protein
MPIASIVAGAMPGKLARGRNTRISASNAARGRNRSTTIPKIILQRSNIPQKIIRFCVSRQLDEIYDRDSRPMSGKAVGGVLGLPTATGARM